ncbi:MAG TPA: VWA domain-containing protein [Vicinamibacterales bacterium]|nr:VWA domain-containing protein [Vicinamibacterales bacterium]
MRAVLAVALALVTWAPMVGASQTPPPPAQGAEQRPTFKATVNRVAVAAVVRDRKGKPVTNLKETDFQLYDSGEARKIVDFRAETSPVSLALLVDFSGSMDVAIKREAAREIAWHILSWMKTGRDQVGLFAFDRRLQELAPFGTDTGEILNKLETVRPFGTTSLFDAIAETSELLAAKSGARRAIVALTDGADNASRLTPEQVSGIASGIDVPVYIVLVISPLDRAGTTTVNEDQIDAMQAGRLGDLARWTGGEIFAAVGPSVTSQAARQIVTELRHQYLFAFEPSTRPGWHPIELRTHDKDLVVRARSGYQVRNGAPDTTR